MFDWRALRDPEKARAWLSHRLLRGRVTLVLGAGVSMPAGIPGWRALLEKTARAADFDDAKVELLLTKNYYDAAEVIRAKLSEEKLALTVRSALYEGVEYGIETIRTPTLIAIGSWLRRDLVLLC